MASDTYLKALTKNRKPVSVKTLRQAGLHELHPDTEDVVGHKVSLEENRDLYNNSKNTGFTLPGSKYIGPGNGLDLGVPKNKTDAVAQKHDIRYSDTKWRYDHGEIDKETAEKEVVKEDTDAIREFYNEGGIQGNVGALGLTIKQGFERIIGHQYPSFSGKLWLLRIILDL